MVVQTELSPSEFMSTVQPDEGGLFLMSFEGRKVRFQKVVPSISDAIKRAEEESAKGRDVYFTVNRLKPEAKERTGENILSGRSFFIDLDCGKGKEYTTQKKALVATYAFCADNNFPKPTFIINSGNGIHAYWVIRVNIPAAKWKLVAKRFKAGLLAAGLKIDKAVTADLVRLLRVPGTQNYKDPVNPKPVRILEVNGDVSAREFIEGVKRLPGAKPAPTMPATAPDVSELTSKYPLPFDLDEFNSAIKEWDTAQAVEIKSVDTKHGTADIDLNEQGDWRNFVNPCVDEYEQAPKAHQAHIKAECRRLSALSEKYDDTGFEEMWQRCQSERGNKNTKTRSHLYIVANALDPDRTTGSSSDVPADPTSSLYNWPEVEPLEATPPREAFPLAALPPVVRSAVKEYVTYAKVPVALAVSSALASVSVAAQGLADVGRTEHLVGPASLMLISIAESGERKSSCDDAFSKGVVAAEAQLIVQREAEINSYESALRAWEGKHKNLEKVMDELAAHDQKKTKALWARYCRDTATPPTSPIDTTLMEQHFQQKLAQLNSMKPKAIGDAVVFISDTSKEALVKTIAEGHPSAAVWDAEAGNTIGSVAMSNDNIVGFMSQLNRFWDGKGKRQLRIEDTRSAQGKRITTNLMAQPTVFKDLMGLKGGVARGIGWMARALASEPESTMGTRLIPETREDTPELGALGRFNDRTEALMLAPLPMKPGAHLELEPPALLLSDDAYTHWAMTFNQVERELADGGEFADIKDWASKAMDNAARLAGLFWMLDNGAPTCDDLGDRFANERIGVDYVQQACDVALWYLREARRLNADMTKHTSIKNALVLWEWLLEWGKPASRSDIAKMAPSRQLNRSKFHRDEAVAVLLSHGYVATMRVGKKHILHPNPNAPQKS